MNYSLNFLKQTASDYDIPLNEVKRIRENNSRLDFYNALEQYLINRRENKLQTKYEHYTII